jgi:hypothetical protein
MGAGRSTLARLRAIRNDTKHQRCQKGFGDRKDIATAQRARPNSKPSMLRANLMGPGLINDPDSRRFLRSSRKTERGASMFPARSVVRAAPFALLRRDAQNGSNQVHRYQ